MAKKALSERIKRQNNAKVMATKLREAVNAYMEELDKDECVRKGVWSIAKEFGIPGQY
jgi:hypothetical protein